MTCPGKELFSRTCHAHRLTIRGWRAARGERRHGPGGQPVRKFAQRAGASRLAGIARALRSGSCMRRSTYPRSIISRRRMGLRGNRFFVSGVARPTKRSMTGLRSSAPLIRASTYAAKGFDERLLLESGARVAIVDPLGLWWGLRASADGGAVGIRSWCSAANMPTCRLRGNGCGSRPVDRQPDARWRHRSL
jgi:hypothetical protein